MGSFNLFFPQTKQLLASTTAASTSAASAAFALDLSSAYTLILDVTGSSSGTSLDVGLQQLASNASWYTILRFTRQTTAAVPTGDIIAFNPLRAFSEAGVEFAEPMTARAATPSVVVVQPNAVANNVVIGGQVGGVASCRWVWLANGTYTFNIQAVEAPRNILAG